MTKTRPGCIRIHKILSKIRISPLHTQNYDTVGTDNTTKPSHQTYSFDLKDSQQANADQNMLFDEGNDEVHTSQPDQEDNSTKPKDDITNVPTQEKTQYDDNKKQLSSGTQSLQNTNLTDTTMSKKKSKRSKRDRWATPSTNKSQFPKMDATYLSRVTIDATPQGKHAIIKERLPKAITTCEFTVRTRWVGEFFNMGISVCARMLINLIREADPLMTVIPTDKEDFDSENFIAHEDDFDDDRYTVWVRKPWCVINTANEFAMRFRSTKTFKCMKEKIVTFMAETGNGVKVDCNKADRVVTIGFFDNFHQHYHNKNELRLYCIKYLKEKFQC